MRESQIERVCRSGYFPTPPTKLKIERLNRRQTVLKDVRLRRLEVSKRALLIMKKLQQRHVFSSEV